MVNVLTTSSLSTAVYFSVNVSNTILVKVEFLYVGDDEERLTSGTKLYPESAILNPEHETKSLSEVKFFFYGLNL